MQLHRHSPHRGSPHQGRSRPLRHVGVAAATAALLAACGGDGDEARDHDVEVHTDETACDIGAVNPQRVQVASISDVVRNDSGILHDPADDFELILQRGTEGLVEFSAEVRVMTVVNEIAHNDDLVAAERWPFSGNEIPLIPARAGRFDVEPATVANALAGARAEEYIALTSDGAWSGEPVAALHGLAVRRSDGTVELIWPCPETTQMQFELAAELNERPADAAFLADLLLSNPTEFGSPMNVFIEGLSASSAEAAVTADWAATEPADRTLYFPGAIPDEVQGDFRPGAFRLYASDDLTGLAVIRTSQGILLNAALDVRNPIIVAMPVGEPATLEVLDGNYTGPEQIEIYDGNGDEEVFLLHIDTDSVRVEIGSALDDVGRVLTSDEIDSYNLEDSPDYKALFQP